MTYVEVLGVNLVVLGLVEVLLRDEHTLAEEVLVDLLAVGLGNQPGSHQRGIRQGDMLDKSSHLGCCLTGVVVMKSRQMCAIRKSAVFDDLCGVKAKSARR